MRRLLSICAVLLLPLLSHAQTTSVVALITFTNTSNGATNGQTITGNGSVRTFTNTITASPSTRIAATNSSGWAATNAWLHLVVYKFTGTDRVSLTNTNQIVIQGSIGSGLTVSLSANLGTVSYSTQTWSTVRNVSYPPMGLANETGRTNNASGLIEVLNDGRATNSIANGLASHSNLLDRISAQTSSNKTFYTTTNFGGLSDGARLTNVLSIVGSNGTLTGLRLNSPFISGFTNASGTNANITNLTADVVTLYRVNLASGYITNLTNGTLWGAFISNGVFNGTVTALTNGYWTNGVLGQATITNLALEGWVSSFKGGFQHLNIGSNNLALGEAALLVGFFNTGTLASVLYGLENTSYSLNGSDILIGTGNYAGTNSVFNKAVGNFNTFSNLVPGNYITYSGAFGENNLITNDHSFIIGNFGRTTEDSQILFAGTTNSVVMEGRLILKTGATNFQTLAGSTNILRGDISYPRATVSTIANGHNTINIGTNVWVDLTGSPSATWTLGAFTGGNRDGKWLIIRNNTGYATDILDNSGTEPTAANRIDTPTGTNITLLAGGCAEFIYDSSASRWVLLNVFNTATPASSSTNSVGSISTNSTLVGSGLTAINWNYGVTGYLSGSMAVLGVSVAGGGGGSESTTTNGNQFLGTPIAIVNGALLTNINIRTALTLPTLAVSSAAVINGAGQLTNSAAVSTTELEYLDGVTSAIQTQFGAKLDASTNANQFLGVPLAIANGALLTNVSIRTALTAPTLTASRVAIINGANQLTNSAAVDTTELEYLDGVTSAIQTQFGAKLDSLTNGNQFLASPLAVKDGALFTNVSIRTAMTMPTLTVLRVAVVNAAGQITNTATVTPTTLEFLDATSSVQTQLGTKMAGSTNLNQFGASTTLAIGDGALLTNISIRTALTLPTLTALRPAFINGAGQLTNASGTPDGTKFLRDDGVLVTPGGGGDVTTVQLNAASNSLKVDFLASDIVTSNGLRTTFLASDILTSNGVVTLVLANDITTSNGVITVLLANDITTSNGTRTAFLASDITTSNGVVTLLLANDIVTSNSLYASKMNGSSNANQFLGTPLALISGVLLTNPIVYTSLSNVGWTKFSGPVTNLTTLWTIGAADFAQLVTAHNGMTVSGDTLTAQTGASVASGLTVTGGIVADTLYVSSTQTNAGGANFAAGVTNWLGAMVKTVLAVPHVTASRVAIINGANQLTNSAGVSTTTLEFLDATSSVQGQLNTLTGSKMNGSSNLNQFLGIPLALKDGVLITNATTYTALTVNNATASRVAVFNAAGQLTNTAVVTPTILEFLDATSSVQTQFGTKMSGSTNGNQFLGTPLAIISGALTTNMSARGLVVPNATVSLPLMVNAHGDVTNVSGTADGTKFVRDDGVLAVPAGTLTTNGNQFLGTPLALKNGLLVTNLVNDTLLTTLNLNAAGTVAASVVTVTNGVGYVTSLEAGTGGFVTNYTLLATNVDAYINGGLTNVSFRHSVGAVVGGLVLYWNRTITNGVANRTLEFSSLTNAWHFAGTYGTNAPSVLTNLTKLFLSGRQDGTNIDVGYAYFSWP